MNMIHKTIISKQRIIAYLILTLITVAIYWQVSQFDFVNIDDNVYVTENFNIKSGINAASLRWAFSTTYAEFWHPLTWLSLMFDYQLYGLNAGGYHVTNLILHILSTLLLFGLFHRMTRQIWPSAFVAAFFALHPLHVESVAWVSERKDVLSAFFWMLTLCLYVYYTEKPAVKRYLLVLFSFVLALMSKPMVVTLPLMMILLDYWPLKRFELNKNKIILWQLKEKLPLFLLSGIFSIITFYAQYDRNGTYFPFLSRLANAPVAFVTYLIKTFYPQDMAVFYPFSVYVPLWQTLGASMMIIVISMTIIMMVKHQPYLLVGWLWFAITLLPVIKIVQVGYFAMADRYHYLSSVGIAVMLAWSIAPLLQRKNIFFTAAIVFCLIMSVITWKQCSYWKNSIDLWNHALISTTNNVSGHIQLGLALLTKGETNKAICHFNHAIDISPNDFSPYQNLGKVYFKMGRYKIAIKYYNQSLRLMPDNAESYFGRGTGYISMGEYPSAIQDFNTSIRLKPDFAEAYNNRASVYVKMGQYRQAYDDYSQAVSLKPDYADAYFNRALILFSTGDTMAGCQDGEKACELGNCSMLQLARGKGLCR